MPSQYLCTIIGSLPLEWLSVGNLDPLQSNRLLCSSIAVCSSQYSLIPVIAYLFSLKTIDTTYSVHMPLLVLIAEEM